MLSHVNWIRGIAALLIVFIHMADGLLYELDNAESLAIDMLAKGATCIFVAISGFFFQLNLPKYSYGDYLSKKINNVIIPYILISIPAILIYVLKFKTEHVWIDMDAFYAMPVVEQFLFMLATGAQLGPLWFIPALALIYLIAPLLKILSEQRTFPLVAAAGILLFLATSRPDNNSNPLYAAIHFVPIYVLGMLFCQHRKALGSRASLYVFGAAVLVLSVVAGYERIFFGLQKTALFFFLYALLLIYQEHITHHLPWLAKTLTLIGLCSFSIYFLHGYFAGLYRAINDHIQPEHFITYLLVRLLLTSITVGVCVGITLLIKKVAKRRSRLLIGS